MYFMIAIMLLMFTRMAELVLIVILFQLTYILSPAMLHFHLSRNVVTA